MRNFWALPAFLRLAIAAQPEFNVHDDLFAYPQYDVIWQDGSPVSDEYAADKLQRGSPQASLSPQLQSHALDSHNNGEHLDSSTTEMISSYEPMMLGSQRYLCSIPAIPPAIPGHQSNRTKEEEANELALAVHRGQELLKGMEGNCVYFISGWWSYSFCYNEGVRQFHPLPSGRNVPIYPPVEDKSVAAYVLGRFEGKEREEEDEYDDDDVGSHRKKNKDQKPQSKETGVATLQVKGQKGSERYLVQHLKGGTICDLTGEERSIEVQFKCENFATDRITLIKETSICQYRMVISTPRLCNDVAFQLPKGPKPHPIQCSPVMPSESIPSYLASRESTVAQIEADIQDESKEIVSGFFEDLKAALGFDPFQDHVFADGEDDPREVGDDAEAQANIKKKYLARVGDIEVGGFNILPRGVKLEKGVAVGGKAQEKLLGTIARSDGFVASDKELARLNIQAGKELDAIREKVRRTAAGAEWQIDVVETARGKELRGIIGDKKEEGKEKMKASKKSKQRKNKEQVVDRENDDDYDDEGSEETYKEEL